MGTISSKLTSPGGISRETHRKMDPGASQGAVIVPFQHPARHRLFAPNKAVSSRADPVQSGSGLKQARSDLAFCVGYLATSEKRFSRMTVILMEEG